MSTLRPLILLTNDDGIDSHGLLAVAEAVSELGDLVISAPATQQTGMGRALPPQLGGPIIEMRLSTSAGPVLAYSVPGSPAQAVLAAIVAILPRKPDVVISGINYGENLGTCVTSSGTVGAALQAADFGIPALAVSLQTSRANHYSQTSPVAWEVAAQTTRQFAALLLERGLPFDVDVLKVDIPEDADIRTAYRFTRQSRQPYYHTSGVAGTTIHEGLATLNYDVEIDWDTLESDSDIHAIARDRIISVTPLSVDLTSRVDLAELDARFRGRLDGVHH